jgi:thiol-disulfide isomerase/thioredoxin
MTGRVLAAAVVVAALLAVGLVVRSAPPVHAPGVVKADLNFTLEDMNGAKVDLKTFAGKPLVINLWATWCVPCEIETPQLVALGDKYRERGLRIVGVSIDDAPAAIREFATRLKVNYPMLVGLGQDDFLRSVQYEGELPKSILVSADGTILESFVGVRKTEDWERRLETLVK